MRARRIVLALSPVLCSCHEYVPIYHPPLERPWWPNTIICQVAVAVVAAAVRSLDKRKHVVQKRDFTQYPCLAFDFLLSVDFVLCLSEKEPHLDPTLLLLVVSLMTRFSFPATLLTYYEFLLTVVAKVSLFQSPVYFSIPHTSTLHVWFVSNTFVSLVFVTKLTRVPVSRPTFACQICLLHEQLSNFSLCCTCLGYKI